MFNMNFRVVALIIFAAFSYISGYSFRDTITVVAETNEDCEITKDSLLYNYYSERDFFYFIKSHSAYMLTKDRLLSNYFIQKDFGDIPTAGLLLNFDYGVSENVEMGVKLNLHSVESLQGLSEIFASLKYKTPFSFENESIVSFIQIRKSFGGEYVKEYEVKKGDIVGITSKYFDNGMDINLGVLMHKPISLWGFDFNTNLGFEYLFLRGRDYRDYTKEQNSGYRIMVNFDRKFSDRLSVGIENRILKWNDRGEMYDIIPQIQYRANYNMVIGAGALIPLIRNDVGLYASLKIDLFDESRPVIICSEGIRKQPPVVDKEKTPCDFDVNIDLSDSEMNFFVTGYYRINTQKNLDDLIEYNKTILRNANYIEKFNTKSAAYQKYSDYAKKIEGKISDLKSTLMPIFDKFLECSDSGEALNLTIYGYTDPRGIRSGVFEEDYEISFSDEQGKTYNSKKGTPMNNIILGGLRSYFTGEYIDKMSTEESQSYQILKSSNKIRFSYVSAITGGKTGDEKQYDAQRRIKIQIQKITK